jgi:hypothetical protein
MLAFTTTEPKRRILQPIEMRGVLRTREAKRKTRLLKRLNTKNRIPTKRNGETE